MTPRKAEAPSPSPRAPRAFRIDDPAIARADDDVAIDPGVKLPEPGAYVPRPLTGEDLKHGVRWSAMLLSAMAALASLAAGLWFTRFVSIAIERQDWVGWIATGLLGAVALALIAILVKELLGFRRMARLSRLRKDVVAALASGDVAGERTAVTDLARHYRGRADMAWGLARLNDHKGDVLAAGDLLRLADRELLIPLDAEARRTILKSAKRVATVTALSPLMLLAVAYVLVENVRMFRGLATLYGGRPGVLGALRLGKLVVGHIIATGGVAMTDDLLGQFLGQDVLRRLSRRLGEGAFNGALTARLGVAAVEVTRPLPFLDADKLRVREIFQELFRSLRGAPQQDEPPPSPTRRT
ncbi:MAG: YcjF family protein [Hyphomicrobium sp.]